MLNANPITENHLTPKQSIFCASVANTEHQAVVGRGRMSTKFREILTLSRESPKQLMKLGRFSAK